MSGLVGGAGIRSGIIGEGATNTHLSQWVLDGDTTGDANPLGDAIGGNPAWINPIASLAGATAGKGAAMTQSAGIFTFPVTGYWLIQAQFRYNTSTAENYCSCFIYTTTNNSTYAMTAACSAAAPGTNRFSQAPTQYIFKVLDTANYKCYFRYDDAQNGNILRGYNSFYNSGATFIRLSGL